MVEKTCCIVGPRALPAEKRSEMEWKLRQELIKATAKGIPTLSADLPQMWIYYLQRSY